MLERERKMQKAKELKEQRLTQEEIAERLNVGIRTVRRYLSEPANKVNRRRDMKVEGWPPERRWPGWTAQDLHERTEWPPELAEENLAIVRQAESLGNQLVPWYYRLVIEVAEEHGVRGPESFVPKSESLLALAGFLVLDEWLGGCLECKELAKLIDEHHPWESKEKKTLYLQAAKPLTRPIKQRLFTASALAKMTARTTIGGEGSPVIYLNALSERVPQIDKAPRFSRTKHWGVGQIFLNIFTFPAVKGATS